MDKDGITDRLKVYLYGEGLDPSHISNAEVRGFLLALSEELGSLRRLAKRVKVSRQTIYNWLKRLS